ncbi:MAG: MTH1187 family thiamine-binding protein [Thermoleophilia bacterium]
MVVAEFSVIPITDGSLRRYVQVALDEVGKAGLRYEIGAMGTTVEGELDQVLAAVAAAHRAVRAAGAGRVVTSVRIDDRDTGVTIAGKLEGLK